MAEDRITTALRGNPQPNQVDQSGIQGEPGTGYENSDGKGEFECQNCTHFDEASQGCDEPHMAQLSQQPKLDDGRVQVDPEGCCEYVNRAGKQEESEEEE